MKSDSRRRRLLIGGVAALGAVVLADQFGWLPGRPALDEGAEGSVQGPREQYLAKARLGEESRRLVAQSGEWDAALAGARSSWDEVRTRLVVAKTGELAEASLRDRVLDALKDLNLQAARANVIPPPSADAAAPVRSISLEVKFDTPSHKDAYAAVDRLEHLPGLATTVTSVKLEGPGRLQVPPLITVSLTVQALAVVGQEG